MKVAEFSSGTSQSKWIFSGIIYGQALQYWNTVATIMTVAVQK